MTKPAPFLSSVQTIEPGWIDYNDHLNMGYYTVMFDRAADEAYEQLGFGPDYRAATGCTTFAAEFHVCYLRELKLGDRVRCRFWLIDHDEKRFHTFQEMVHEDGWVAATGEGMSLHVDLTGPKVAAMPDDIHAAVARMAKEHAQLPRPAAVGRAIGIRRG